MRIKAIKEAPIVEEKVSEVHSSENPKTRYLMIRFENFIYHHVIGQLQTEINPALSDRVKLLKLQSMKKENLIREQFGHVEF